MTDFKRSGNSSLRSKLRGIKPAVIEPELKWKMLQAGVKAVVHKRYAVDHLVEIMHTLIECRGMAVKDKTEGG